METFKHFTLTFTAVFVALDIIGTLPMYASMTQDLDRPARVKIVNTSMGVAFLVALVFIFAGQLILRYLGITLIDFKIAGGLVLLLVSLADLVGQPESGKRFSGSTGVVPLAVPLITGPGVLTTLLLQVESIGIGLTLIALILNYFLAWALLMQSNRITLILGRDGTAVISKIAALLLAAIAVSMMRAGIFEAIRKGI